MGETPIQESPRLKYPGLSSAFEKLDSQKGRHYEAGQNIFDKLGGNLHVTHMVVMAVLKRSLDILDGVSCMIDKWNFVAAAPLLRLQLDNLLRLHYLVTVENPDSICIEILREKSFKDLKDSEGKALLDVRLREHARARYPFVDSVYGETSKLVHLSDRHIFLAIQSFSESSGVIDFLVGQGNQNWKEPEMKEFLDALNHTTDQLLKILA